MLKNYPATYLFLLSLIPLIVLSYITPLVSGWYLVTILLEALTFTTKFICITLLIGAIIEIVSSFRKLQH
ncbi:hypothetical protein MAMMFC1_02538 [Methylomusa anaerophila]|uniref:Uncharacterized protein n=1 Tax=Methylomusa anaerophila TaxID=1930071 RepID=A0A348ALA5_9FIRM|nr:hypothetical protein MAMMFC1_02538 [Methylomusa anaerophila]